MVFAAVHVWQIDGLRLGRIGFMMRFRLDGAAWLAATTLLVVLPLLVHAGLGARIVGTRPEEAGPYPDLGVRRLQHLSGGMLLLFMGLHLTQGWLQRVQGERSELIYELLRDDLAGPVFVPIYVLGLAALGLHSAQGLAAFGRRFWPEARRLHRGFDVFGLVFGVLTFLVGVNGLAHLAMGRAFILPIAPPMGG